MSQDALYDFDWDPGKAASNQRDHGITFDQAATVFLDALALTVYDVLSSHSEERWFTLGCDVGGKLLAVAHTYQETESGRVRIRIISARKATRRERRSDEEEEHQ
jgi:uncharacterized DUF497 family protein